jgi:iron-sulfur cluster assembly protein
MTTQQPIHKDMTIEEIFSNFPQKSQLLAQEMTNRGLHCVGCGAASFETLEAGMLGHGMDHDEIESLAAKLNEILNEDTSTDSIELTPRAAKKFLEILDQEGKTGWGLRFAEKLSGCNGFEFILDYSKGASEEDEIFLSHGVEIHVEKKKVSKLMGSLIDWVDGLQGAGFKVTNPNVTSSCHCGTSHGY